MERWSGKVAIVTGASSGIGEAIAASLVKAGMLVVGLARRAEQIEKKAAELAKSGAKGKLFAHKCDMRREEDIIAAFAWATKNVGIVHVLVNNAGVSPAGNLVAGTTEDWRAVLEVNVLGLCIATREAAKIMMAHQVHGHIIQMNSITGQSHMYFPTVGVYGASKHAVTNLNEMLRQEMVALKANIKSTSISPGAVKTDILNAHMASEEMKAFLNMPMLEAQDIADGVLYILGVPERVHINELTITPATIV